jgi:hypothetical protein
VGNLPRAMILRLTLGMFRNSEVVKFGSCTRSKVVNRVYDANITEKVPLLCEIRLAYAKGPLRTRIRAKFHIKAEVHVVTSASIDSNFVFTT